MVNISSAITAENWYTLILLVAVVFLGLLFVMLILYIMRFIFTFIDKRKKISKSISVSENIADGEDEEETVAAITAAIMCYYGQSEQETAVPFKIRDIRRIR